ncbi:MAG: PHP domain-containing protein [Candidatus Nitrosopelagicus sp.]|nr:PHP domain-containing protein [Candidatus Nitrosopelagicus sp.]MBT6647034.1 PHP domain-containing protein [Nitrososphaerota archaeon]MBT4325918.1 PHP domain-containing protein [Candidatus Nitrosopelagicus sp.]MBT4455145.1 PHP domain-containing protein [Candidatus Nitrosopelagicus sp.]MBT5170763.1 PHP domain-containing protein [Candidatus Nitrosopelagicus sp.]
MLRTELHCHNVYSNGHVGDLEPPFDCNVSISEQLEKSLESKLDVLFVTNHNTLDGFNQITDYKNDHEKFSNLKIYPAVEITTDKEAHVLVYGLHEEIKSNQTLDEIIDAAKSQDAITIAPHPFSLIDALRDDSLKCDLFEVFNSSNIDIYSNKKAEIFAKEKNLLTTAGSDSHIASTIGRCTNLIDSQNNLDDVIHAMKKGKISIEKTEYVTHREVLEHIQYKIENSKEYIDKYIQEFYPKYFWLFNQMYKSYMFTKKSFMWRAVFKIALFGLRRISYKINFEGYDPYAFRTRDIPTMTKMIF